MSTGSVHVDIFSGIATVEVNGTQYDTYMTIHTESIGYVTRWFGTFSWMGVDPTGYDVEGKRSVRLSDGRQCVIEIPHYDAAEKVEFLGLGLPPGFEPFGLDLVQEPEGLTTPSRARRAGSRLFKFLSFLCLVAAIWLGGYHWQLAASAGLFWLVAGLLSIPPRPPKVPRHDDSRLPLDVPHS